MLTPEDIQRLRERWMRAKKAVDEGRPEAQLNYLLLAGNIPELLDDWERMRDALGEIENMSHERMRMATSMWFNALESIESTARQAKSVRYNRDRT